jgi:hypothetical protein
MSQLADPAFIVAAVTLMVDGALNATLAAHPAPTTVAVAPAVKRNPDGRLSVNAMPDCAGLPTVFVNRKLSSVLPPMAMLDAAKLLVNVGGNAPVVTRRH